MANNLNLSSYALAIFELAKDKDTQDKYYQQILLLDKIAADNQDLVKTLSCRAISKNERKQVIEEIGKDLNLDKQIIYWVWTIIDNNQFAAYHDIVKQCTLVHHIIFNIIKLDITSAYELNAKQLEKITSFFTDKFKVKVDLSVKIDKKLIGGLKIQLNNKTYNNTFKSKLESLKNSLLSRKE